VPLLVWPVAAVILAVCAIWAIWQGRVRLMQRFGLEHYAKTNVYLGGVLAIAMLLSPFWLILLYYTLTSFFVLTSTPVLGLERADQVWHFVTVSALIITLGVLVTGPMMLAKAFINERQTATSEARQKTELVGMITDRFASAVAQLGAQKSITQKRFKPTFQRIPGGKIRRDLDGNPMIELDADKKPLGEWEVWEETEPNIEIRLGGLFALERISQTSTHDHVSVMETISAYIRENAVSEVEVEAVDDEPAQYLPPRADIQMAIRILGRRGPVRMAQEAASEPPFRLDLRGADLALIDLSRLEIGPVRFDRANLSGAWLDGANLSGSDFTAASLREAWMEDTQLIRVRLEEADLRGAWAVNADFTGAELDGTNLTETRLRGADLTGVELDSAVVRQTDVAGATLNLTWLRNVDCKGFLNLEQAQIDAAFGDFTTNLPGNLKRAHWPKGRINYVESYELWAEAKKAAGVK